jgi:hypothetical protein
MFTCEKCGLEQMTKTIPCPDGRVGCCVAHYGNDAYVCTKCGHDNTPDWENTTFTEEVGEAIINVEAVKKLRFS